jgi:hypothetical protein
MYTVDIEKRCGCVKKDESLELPQRYSSKEEAELAALRLANHMNATYCKKHRFYAVEEGKTITIMVELSCPETV